MRKVIDTATRTYHWLFAICFLGAYLTAESEKFRLLHATLGYTMAGLLVFRVLWGLFGPRHVRLSAMFRKLGGYKTLVAAYRNGTLMQFANLRQAANVLMTAVIVILLLLVIPLTLSGYTIFNDLTGHWMEEIHESVGEFMLAMVIFHLAMIGIVSVLRRNNLTQSMLTGYTAGDGPDLIKQDHRLISVVMVVSVMSWMIGYMFYLN